MPRAAIVTVGNELLAGDVENTNGSWLARELAALRALPGLTWQPRDANSNRTMVWDNQCRMVDDPEGEARRILLT